jgi:hypothetical protein
MKTIQDWILLIVLILAAAVLYQYFQHVRELRVIYRPPVTIEDTMARIESGVPSGSDFFGLAVNHKRRVLGK